MLRLAAQFPLAEWARGGVSADEAVIVERGAWSLQGVRPANHPRVRLRQYAGWANAWPDWPTRLEAMARRLPAGETAATVGTTDYRRAHEMRALRHCLSGELCAGAVGGSRLDNLICDGFLPLLAARTGRELAAAWYHWFAGDLPKQVFQALRALGAFAGRPHPACHGAAQGLWGWLIEREARLRPAAPATAGRRA